MHHGFAPHSLHSIKEGKLQQPKSRDETIFKFDYLNKIDNERFGDMTDLINNMTITK